MSEDFAFDSSRAANRSPQGDVEDAQAALRDSQDRLRQVTRAAQLTYVEVDFPTGRMQSAENFAAIMGFGPGPEGSLEIASGARLILDHVVAADHASVNTVLRAFLDGQAVPKMRFRVAGSDGRERFIESVCTVQYTPAGKPHRGLAIYADITQRLRTEETLGESEARYRSALKAGRMGSWETDLVSGKRAWSKEGMDLFGLKLTDGIGKVGGDEDEYLLALHPDDRHLAQWFHALAEKEDSFAAEYRIVRPDGRVLWLTGRGLVVSRQPNGKVRRLVSIMADVTERRQAEEQLRIERERLALALQAGQMGAYDSDLRTGVLWWSPQTYAVFGVAADEFVPTPESVTALIHPDDRDHFSTERSGAIAEHRPLFIEFRIVRPDGAVVWLGHRGQTAYDVDGRPVRHFGIAMDITDRKQADQNLRDADRQKDNFIATLAHELRNPLAPIRNAINLMRRKNVTDAQAAWCRDVIDRQVGQMSHLLEDLLDLSRMTRGKIQLRIEPLSFLTVIERAIEVAQPVIHAAAHSLSVELPAEPIALEGDLTRLAQVFSNLLINAAKYTQANGRIRLSAQQQGQDLLVSVSDSGIGITAAQMPYIFEMFAQIESALDRSQGGLGIGLSLAKRLIEMHGGQISASSEGAGKGSEFVVRLPIAVKAGQLEISETHVLSGTAGKGPLRILIADDLRDSADSLAMELESMGHMVMVAYDGEQAVQMCATFRPEVAFLDLGMPKLNGYETCRQIRLAPGGIQVTLIAQTGWGQEVDRLRTRDAGFDHHLVKPIDSAALLKLLGAISAGSPDRTRQPWPPADPAP